VPDKLIESNEDFYNSIASDYNARLTDKDRVTRERVSRIFTDAVETGNVLDFGGGTGLDVEWLKSKYKVYFLEPAAGMRAEAKKLHAHDSGVVFIEDSTDFANWSIGKLPVPFVSGVIANFAVLNCVADVSLFFEKMSLILKKGNHLLITIIDPHFSSLAGGYSIMTAMKSLMSQSFQILHQHEGRFHATFIHSMPHMKTASSPYFKIKSITRIKDANFIVIMFGRL
jgi:hypothetical protein